MASVRYIVGAGAQGRVVLETWRAQAPSGEFRFVDDDPARGGEVVLGVSVVGSVTVLARAPGEAILAIGHNPRRLELAAQWTASGVTWATAIHPSAVVMASAKIGPGTVILPGAIIHTGARVGAHVIINTAAIIEHDAEIGDGASISPGVCSGGRIKIGRGAFIGVGVTLAPRVSIGAGSVIGAGAVVVDDIPAGVLAYGAPARVIRGIEAGFDWRTLL